MHPIVKTVSTLVYGGDIDQAERALVLLADEEGDRALANVIEALPPRDVVAILREHDSSKTSVISELISPEQFLAAVSLEKGYKDRGHDALKGMINAVLFADDRRTDAFIEALGSSEAGLDALVDYFRDRHEEVEHFFRHGTFALFPEGEFDVIGISGTDDLLDADLDDADGPEHGALSEVQDGDWRELAWRLRCEHYEIFRVVLELLRARRRAALAAPTPLPASRGVSGADEEEDEDDGDDVL